MQSRLSRPWISSVRHVSALLIPAVVIGSAAWAQGQPPASVPAPPRLSEAERPLRIQERDQRRAAIIELARAGKLDEAAALSEKEVAAARNVTGENHEDLVRALQFLAGLQEARQDWAAARGALAEVLAIREHQPDRKDWQIAEARQYLAYLDQRAALNPSERRRLLEANRLDMLRLHVVQLLDRESMPDGMRSMPQGRRDP